jgi:hypothetical protein
VTRYHVLSLKQPWAALLAAGRKSVEIRRWQTAYRGLVLIHAARVPDAREQAWARVPPDLLDQAQLGGGIIGVGVLSAVKFYSSAEAFALEKDRHLNEPDWFEPAGLFGFSFADLRPTPFRRLVGQVRLFSCEMDDFALPDAPRPAATSGRADRIRRSLSRLSPPPKRGEPA